MSNLAAARLVDPLVAEGLEPCADGPPVPARKIGRGGYGKWHLPSYCRPLVYALPTMKSGSVP